MSDSEPCRREYGSGNSAAAAPASKELRRRMYLCGPALDCGEGGQAAAHGLYHCEPKGLVQRRLNESPMLVCTELSISQGTREYHAGIEQHATGTEHQNAMPLIGLHPPTRANNSRKELWAGQFTSSLHFLMLPSCYPSAKGTEWTALQSSRQTNTGAQAARCRGGSRMAVQAVCWLSLRV